MANAGYIIVKNKEGQGERVTYKSFYGPLDKGSSKPSFCYPRMQEEVKREIESIENALDHGFIDKTKEMQIKAELKAKKKRLSEIESQNAEKKKLFNQNKDAWMTRRKELAEEIAATLPTERDVQKWRVNPHRIYENEKKKGLGEKKLEYQILSHLAEEESNTSFLQKES